MRFTLTLNMPSSKGSAVHQTFVEHSSATLEAFIDELNRQDFVIVEEYFFYNNNDAGGQRWEHRGSLGLSHSIIGKIKVFEER